MTKRVFSGIAGVIAGLLLSVGGVSADTAGAQGAQKSAQEFLKEAAQGGMAEVALGQMAADKAQSDEVKQFGQRMVKDHTKLNAELKDLAASENVTLPTEMGAEHKQLEKRLSGLSGAEFDRVFMQEISKDHKKDIKAFKHQAEQGQDPEVKNFAATALPTLQEHMELAQSAAKEVGVQVSEADTSAGTMSSADKSQGKMGSSQGSSPMGSASDDVDEQDDQMGATSSSSRD